jgi:hypothetical protein
MANNITINVKSYNQNTMSLIVSFSDGTHTTTDVHVQPYVYGADNTEDMLKMLAITGSNMLLTEVKRRNFAANFAAHAEIRSVVNTSVTFSRDEILDMSITNNGLEVQI